jgi:hypothetical protein
VDIRSYLRAQGIQLADIEVSDEAKAAMREAVLAFLTVAMADGLTGAQAAVVLGVVSESLAREMLSEGDW